MDKLIKDRREIFKFLQEKCVDAPDNCGKLIKIKASAGSFYWTERTRLKECKYFQTRIRGNHIITTKSQFFVDDKPVNGFAEIFVPAFLGHDVFYYEKREQIIKLPIQDYEKFPLLYRAAATHLFCGA